MKSSFTALGTASDTLVEKIAKQAQELQDAGNKYAMVTAVIRNLGEIIEERGVHSVEDFAFASNEAVKVVLALVDGMISEKDAVEALNDVVPILVENIDEIGAEGIVHMRGLIVATREMGIEIEELTEFVDGMISTGVAGFEDLGKNLEGLTENQLEAIKVSFGVLAQEMFDSGLTGQEVINKLTGFLKAAKEAGIDLGKEFNILKGLAVKLDDEGIRGIVDRLRGFAGVMESINGLGLLTEETFGLLEKSITDSFDQLIGKGLTSDEALLLMVPHLGELMRLADLYGFELSEATQELIDQAREAGFTVKPLETMEDIMGDIRDILADIRDGFVRMGIVGEDQLEKIRRKGKNVADDLRDRFGNVLDDMDFPDDGFGGDPGERGGVDDNFGRGGIVPPTPSGAMIARVHSGEIIGDADKVVGALQLAMKRMNFSPNMGDTTFAPNIELKIGRRALRQAVKEVMRSGTIDGDIQVQSDSVLFFK
jgi:hypothetical protein